MKILFTIPNFITAGSGGAMLNVIRRLDRKRFEPAVCVSRKGGRLDRVVEEMGIQFIEAPLTIPARPLATLPWRAHRAARIFRPFGFDAWHSFHYSDDYTEPLIAYLSGARAWMYTKKNMNWRRRSWHVRSLLARGIAAQNKAMLASFFGNAFYRGKTSYVPRGVELEKFVPAAEPAWGLRAKYALGGTAPLILAVGHLLPVKGHPTLLRALACEGMQGAHLCIAGSAADEEYAETLRRLCVELDVEDRVHFLGEVREVAALHAEADIFVHPTRPDGRQEGCPVALLEAMACGKACVATNVAGSQDLIEDGQSGLLVESLDEQALANAFVRLIRDPGMGKKLGEGARRRVEEQFSIEREVQLHEEMYTKILLGDQAGRSAGGER